MFSLLYKHLQKMPILNIRRKEMASKCKSPKKKLAMVIFKKTRKFQILKLDFTRL